MISIRKLSRYILIFMVLWLVFVSRIAAAEPDLSAHAVVENTEVFVGESFIFQIRIQGHDSPENPDLSAINEFSVQELGGRRNSSSSITIINGKVSKTTNLGYVFSYRLTPEKAGIIYIPSISVSAGSQTVKTNPVRLKVVEPSKTEDFILRLELSSTRCYVGQPIILTVTWYIGKDVERFRFGLPILTHPDFDFADIQTKIDANQSNLYMRIPLDKGEVIGKKAPATLKDKEYLTLSFQKVLIPQKTGSIKIPQGTVACEAVVGYRKSGRSSDLFDDFFGKDFFFGSSQQAVLRKFVIPSNEPILNVIELPKSGQSPGFTGLVGKYTITSTAEPTEVCVGDPITLNIKVTGPDYLDNIELPQLNKQADLTNRFKIPEEMAPGNVEGRVKTFTQTIRAKNAGVNSIPSIELPYFDPERGEYAIARTEPIPLKVSAAHVVTASDAEGPEVPQSSKTELETWTKGIAYNYEDFSVLVNQEQGPAIWIRSPSWMALIGLPPLVYLVLLISTTVVRRRKADPEARKARQAYGEFMKSLKKFDVRETTSDPDQAYTAVLEAFRQYLGDKLRMAPGALTYNDVKDVLRELQIDANDIERLKKLFEKCEASRYANTNVIDRDSEYIIKEAITLAKNLEKRLQ